MKLMCTNFVSEDATVITASSQDPNFPVSNFKNQMRSKCWRSTDVTSENVVFDLITTEEIDSVVVLWTKEDGPKLSDSATITIQANATNVWTSPAVSQVLTINDTYEIASYYFSNAKSYRYWRIVITDPGNPYGYLEIGKIWLGSSIQIQNAQNGFKFYLTDQSVQSTTPFGHAYTDVYPTLASLDFTYANMTYADYALLEAAFRLNGNHLPVMIVVDPFEAVFNKDHFAIYGLFSNKNSSWAATQVNYNILTTDTITVQEIA